MSDPAWPLADVNPLAETYQEVLPNRTVTFKPDRGPTQIRRVATAGATSIRAHFRVDNTDWATLLSFLETDCKDGAQQFTYTHPIDGSMTLKFIPPIARKVVSGTRGSLWDVQLDLEVQP